MNSSCPPGVCGGCSISTAAATQGRQRAAVGRKRRVTERQQQRARAKSRTGNPPGGAPRAFLSAAVRSRSVRYYLPLPFSFLRRRGARPLTAGAPRHNPHVGIAGAVPVTFSASPRRTLGSLAAVHTKSAGAARAHILVF